VPTPSSYQSFQSSESSRSSVFPQPSAPGTWREGSRPESCDFSEGASLDRSLLLVALTASMNNIQYLRPIMVHAARRSPRCPIAVWSELSTSLFVESSSCLRFLFIAMSIACAPSKRSFRCAAFLQSVRRKYLSASCTLSGLASGSAFDMVSRKALSSSSLMVGGCSVCLGEVLQNSGFAMHDSDMPRSVWLDGTFVDFLG
jgi:hypothetical protein